MTREEIREIYKNSPGNSYEAAAILTLAVVIAEIFGQKIQEKIK